MHARKRMQSELLAITVAVSDNVDFFQEVLTIKLPDLFTRNITRLKIQDFVKIDNISI